MDLIEKVGLFEIIEYVLLAVICILGVALYIKTLNLENHG